MKNLDQTTAAQPIYRRIGGVLAILATAAALAGCVLQPGPKYDVSQFDPVHDSSFANNYYRHQ